MSTVRKYFGLNQVGIYDPSAYFNKQKYPVTEAVESKRGIGIEVEVENNAPRSTMRSGSWTSTADGSLRNSGMEYVSQPIPASLAPSALYELLGLGLDDKECCFSPRTSVHVHVNVQEEECDDVLNAVMLYTVFEKMFFKFTGRGRAKNIYCVPVAETGCLSCAVNTSLDHLRSTWSKYSAVNIVPLGEYGTLEFRHMHGTFDIRKLCIWIRLITKLVDWACDPKHKTRAVIEGLNETTDYQQLLREIFTTDAEYMKYVDYSDVKLGLSRVRTAFTDMSVSNALSVAVVKTSPYFIGA